MNILIKSYDDIWIIPLQNKGHDIHKPWHQPITGQNMLDILRTQEYLKQVRIQLSKLNKEQQKNKAEQKAEMKDQKIQQNIKNKQQNQQNKIILNSQKKIEQLTNMLNKNILSINQIIIQMTKMKKQVQIHGQKIQIQQNKFMKIVDDLTQIKKQNQHKIKTHINKSPHYQKIPVPDIVRQKLSIDLHSSYLQKFDINGTLIKYIGQDKQATQLLSNKIYGINQINNKKLKSILKIIYTKGKCIKFGIIDNKYVNQRSAWNYPNIIYLHAWGHTLIGGHQKDHDLCDYGTDDIVQMNVNFQIGQIQWKINNKSMVILNNQPVKKLLKSNNVQWVPFIAMYNTFDCVQWKICKNQ